MVIRQGDIFWVELIEPSGSAPGSQRMGKLDLLRNVTWTRRAGMDIAPSVC